MASSSPYVLQASVEAHSVRTLRAMLQCLDRFGKELFLECNDTEVTLRTLNAAQSAFIIFTLHASFFHTYQITQGASASVKLHLKNVTSIFRSSSGVDKVWLQVATDNKDKEGGDSEAFMRVQLHCSSGLRKKFDLSFHEVTSMNAVYDKSVCPHTICADPQTLLECLKNFPPSLAEVSLSADAEHLTLKNEVEASDDADADARLVRTEMRLKPEDLRHYELGPLPPGGAVTIAFSIKEFKAVLTLVKDIEHLIVAHIEAPGRPIIFGTRPKQDVQVPFRMECVLATVVETTSMGDDDAFGDMFADEAAAEPTGGGFGGGIGAAAAADGWNGAAAVGASQQPAAWRQPLPPNGAPPATEYSKWPQGGSQGHSRAWAAQSQNQPPQAGYGSWLDPGGAGGIGPSASGTGGPESGPAGGTSPAAGGGLAGAMAPSAKAADDSDTEEDEDAVPGTPPDPPEGSFVEEPAFHAPRRKEGSFFEETPDDGGYPNKRPCW